MSFVKNQFHTSVKTIRVDNGTEFLPLQNFFNMHGIELQYTCVYTLQQNGVIERKHRHILNVARSLLFQSRIPLHFWGECVLMAVYLINQLPLPILSIKSPFQILYNRPPSLDNLKVFGCQCYATVVHYKYKFDPHATICIFMGYPHGQKGYKLYDLHKKKDSLLVGTLSSAKIYSLSYSIILSLFLTFLFQILTCKQLLHSCKNTLLH